MSLKRLALRLATVKCLTKQPGDTHAPTLAGDKVFDSRLDDLEFDQARVDLPIILVYTDAHQGVHQTYDGSRQLEHVDLRIEIAIGTFQKDPDNNQMLFGYPVTDAELEALLDIFEAQVWNALWNPVRAASVAWQDDHVISLSQFESHPRRDADGNNRLAARALNLRIRVKNNCFAGDFTTDPSQIVADPSLPYFPDAPYLNPLIDGLAQDPNYAGLMQMLRLAQGGAPSTLLPRLERVGLVVDAIDPADPNRLATLGRTRGPDGRVEVQKIWTIPNE